MQHRILASRTLQALPLDSLRRGQRFVLADIPVTRDCIGFNGVYSGALHCVMPFLGFVPSKAACTATGASVLGF